MKVTNSINRKIMYFICGFLLTTIFYLPLRVSAVEVWNPPHLQFQPMTLPFMMESGNILIDNFEYWDNPRNHGWIAHEPTYPMWGAGIGYGQLFTILDFQEGSRVLDVYMPPSVFLPNLQRFAISKAIYGPDQDNPTIGGDENNCVSFKIRAPLAIEMFNTFSFMINVTLDDADKSKYTICLIPRDTSPGALTYEELAERVSEPSKNQPGVINLNIGRQYADGTWHVVYIDLKKAIEQALGAATPIESINSITIAGNQYRLDDIIFHVHDHEEGDPPYLFKIGPIFAQLFAPLQRLIYATDDFCHPYDVYTDSNDIRQAWIDDNSVDPSIDLSLVDCNIPVFAEQHMRLSDQDHAEDMLRFNAFIGGGGSNGSWSPNLISPLPVDPNEDDPYPLFLPAYYRLMCEDGDEVEQGACGASHCSEGTFFFPPERVRNIELALKQAGYDYWPNVAILQITPQYLEELIVTVEVSDGMAKDVETFPLSVVNYPIENYPPLMEDVDDQIAYVGEVFEYPLSAVDPDTCIYSMTHPKMDQFELIWNMTLAGLPSYQYGPWSESLINQSTGLIRFTPQFEGAYPAVITVRDSRGYYTIGEFTIFCVNSGTWMNHAPIVMGDWDHPQVCRAGDLFVLSEPTLAVEDPDGDKLYYSCNIGSIGTDADGHVIWTFQTNFPGFYVVDIVAYDAKGAFTTVALDLEVRPWWSL